MSLNMRFINPNTVENVDKHLPKILAEALINKITKEIETASNSEDSKQVHHS
ncbi:MAG: hypothetical protein E6713_02455 [Sporomusaceae bacterium]|nr:hypothetical protein [Sporomusaceae bacterium]